MHRTVDDIIEALGGTMKAAELLGVSGSAVSVWRANGQIPASYLLKFEQRLGELPSECFGFKR